MAGTALAQVAQALPAAPVGEVSQLRAALARVEQQANLVTPIVSPDFIPPMHRVSLRAVGITAGRDTDTYKDRQFWQVASYPQEQFRSGFILIEGKRVIHEHKVPSVLVKILICGYGICRYGCAYLIFSEDFQQKPVRPLIVVYDKDVVYCIVRYCWGHRCISPK